MRSLEEDPAFDAGRGAVLTSQGSVELDAVIMDGRDLDAGAVAAGAVEGADAVAGRRGRRPRSRSIFMW